MKKKLKPNRLTYSQVQLISMTTGGEKRISKTIHEGRIKQWVGIGWVDEGVAKPAYYYKYPEVRND